MDKDESTKPGNDVDASQASLNQEIGGKKRSLSQKFATLNNGIIDVNTNLHIFDSTQKKEEEEEQHRSVLGNQYQQSKRENESHLLRNSPPQYHSPRHYLGESNLQSRNNPFSNEPQKMSSSQYDHGVEQPVNHGSKVVDITEFFRFLIARVDADRKSQLRFLFYKFKRIEITREDFIRRLRRVVGDEMARYAINNVSHLQQVNLPSPSGTIPAGANVRTIPKMPFVGRKKTLESLGSSLPPSSKKQKLCGTSLHQSIEQLNDVTALSGINLKEEEERLLFSGSKKGGRVSEESQRVAHEEDVRTILQRAPLQRKMKEIMAKSGLKHINDDVELCLSRCVEERLHGLLSNAIRVSKQRTDAEKCRKRTCITSDIRKQLYEMNQKAKEEWESKHCGEEKLKSEDNETARKVTRLEQVKANKEQERAKAANVAVRAAVGGGGGDDTFLKWKRMVEEARQKPSSRPRINSMRPCAETGGRRFEKNQGSTKVARTITVEDVIAVLEKEQQMSRSTLLYRLYNRICSDVGRQDKT